MRNNVPPFVAVLALMATVACTEVVDLEQTAGGCMWDSECAMGEFCNAYGECKVIDDGRKTDEPEAESAEPETSSPENSPEVLAPAPESAEPSALEPEADEPEVAAEPEEDAPECVDDSGCSNGLTCIDERCVVGCDGIPTQGVCTPFELSFCANPGTPTEQVRTESITDPVCFGDLLVDSCSADGVPVGVDCVAQGGDCSQGACISMPQGAACDDDTLLCGDDDAGQPLACGNKDANGVGVCESGCGDLTAEGQCTGATMRFCADEGLATERIESYTCTGGDQCGEMRPGVFGCVGAQGQGATCWDPVSGDETVSFCGGNGGGLACELDIEDGEGRCVPNNDTCDNAMQESTCSQNRLMLYCYQSQPIVLNCSDYGGQCNDNIGACTGVDRFQPCDNDLRCASGLQCRQGWCDI